MNWLCRITSGVYQGGSLYHGTNKRFDSFDLNFAGARDWGDFGIGIYLSSSSNLATVYAHEAVKNNGGGEPVVCIVKANLSNIASFDELMDCINSIEVPIEKDLTNIKSDGLQSRPEIDSRKITECMISRGFDSAQVGQQFVVYDSSLLSITRVVSTEEAQWLP